MVGNTATSQREQSGSNRNDTTREQVENAERSADSAGGTEAESRQSEVGEKNVHSTIGEQIQAAEAEVNTNPTEAQKKASKTQEPTISQEGEKGGENDKEDEIKASTFEEEVLDNGDKRITGYNSRGELNTIAVERNGKVVSVDKYEEGRLFERSEFDENGMATSVTRYDKQGNVVGTQNYVNGTAQSLTYSLIHSNNGKRINKLPRTERAMAQRKALEDLGIFAEVSLPKGAKWKDGKKFGHKGGKKSNSTLMTALVVGNNLYIKGVSLPGTNSNHKNNDVYVIRDFKKWPTINEFKTVLIDHADIFLSNEESDAIDEIFSEKIAEFAIILELNGYSGCMEIG